MPGKGKDLFPLTYRPACVSEVGDFDINLARLVTGIRHFGVNGCRLPDYRNFPLAPLLRRLSATQRRVDLSIESTVATRSTLQLVSLKHDIKDD